MKPLILIKLNNAEVKKNVGDENHPDSGFSASNDENNAATRHYFERALNRLVVKKDKEYPDEIFNRCENDGDDINSSEIDSRNYGDDNENDDKRRKRMSSLRKKRFNSLAAALKKHRNRANF